MASNYRSLKCDCCAGALEYSKEKRVWICQYCGNEIRREEKYDGLYTIKNVVKQTLTDIAYNRLDSAEKNLVECEKIASNYVGTVIARMSLLMFRMITPGACPEGAVKSLIAQLKRSYETLQEIDSGISAEEEALYEAFTGADDAFGVLLLVFDSLGDTVHCSFVENMINPAGVYSVSLNENLLHYSMKNAKDTLTENILDNVENIDCKKALFWVIKDYRDGEDKKKHVRELAKKAKLEKDERRTIEDYLQTSSDSLDTKVCVYCEAAEAGAAASIEYVEAYLLKSAGEELKLIEEVLDVVCRIHPNDAELYYLIEKIYTVHSGKNAAAEMELLGKSDLFLSVSAKIITMMLNRRELSAEEKLKLLEIAEKKELEQRANDSILSAYLCSNQDDTATRMKVIDALLGYVKVPSTSTVENYILKCGTDGLEKAKIVEKFFALDLTLSFFRELLQKYIKTSTDEVEVKKQIEEILIRNGLTIDSGALTDLACSVSESDIEEKITFLKEMTKNGTKIKSDALSCYLERGQTYNPHILNILHLPESTMTVKALNNYVLHGNDENGMKAQNALVFAEKAGYPFGSTECRINFHGDDICCNLFQAYILLAKDSEMTVTALTNAMKNARTKLTPNMTVNGNLVKFKKYVTDHKKNLSELALKICEENKVFSFLF